MDNTFKIGGDTDTAAQTTSSASATPPPASQTQQSVSTQATQIPQPISPPSSSATSLPTSPATSSPQQTTPVINNKLNVQLDKSVNTQLSRLGMAGSKILSAKSYLVIGILIIALTAAAYGAYIFFFAEEPATEESFEGIPLTNKLGGSESSEKISSPPSLTINLSKEEDATTNTSTDLVEDTNTPANTPTDSKIPR